MPLTLSRTAFPWVARGASAAVLALVLAVLLLMPPHPLPWLAAGLAVTVGAASLLAATWRGSTTASAPTSAFVGS
jgi:hypothetical protein